MTMAWPLGRAGVEPRGMQERYGGRKIMVKKEIRGKYRRKRKDKDVINISSFLP